MILMIGVLSPPICYLILDGAQAHCMIIIVLWFIALFLSVSIYGNEFKDKTFRQLLSQPISRKRIWYEKLLALFVSIIVLFLYSQIYTQISNWFIIKLSNSRPTTLFQIPMMFYWFYFFITLSFISTGIYLSLIFKNEISALVVSIALVIITIIFWNTICEIMWSINKHYLYHLFKYIHDYFTPIPFILLTSIFYIFGYKKFMKMEVV